MAPGRSDGSSAHARVSVLIIHYRTPDLLRQCLESLTPIIGPAGSDVIVVDNASGDLTPDWIENDFPGVRLLAQSRNLGYSRAVNLAISEASGELFLVLNPDIIVPPDAIGKLVAAADEHPEVGVIAPKLLNPDGSLQHSCRRFYDFKTFVYRRTPLGKLRPNSEVLRHHLMLDYDHRTPRVVDWVLGGAMLVRREAVEDVGGMDERFFLYFEDVDWCYRMHQRGWRVLYVPDAEMVHHHRRESARKPLGKSFMSHLMSVVRFYEKWSLLLYVLKTQRELMGRVLRLLADIVGLNVGFIAAYAIRLALGAIFQKPVLPASTYLNFWLFGNALAIGTFYILGFYRRQHGADWVDRLFTVLRGTGIVMVVMMATTFLLYTQRYSRFMVTLFWPMSTLFIWLCRQGLTAFGATVREQRLDLPRVAVAGSPESVDRVRVDVAERGDAGFEPIYLPGFAPRGGGAPGTDPERDERFLDLVRAERISSVYFVSPGEDASRILRLVPRLARAGVASRIRPEFAPVLHPDARVESVAGSWALALDVRTRWQVGGIGKRLIDLVASSLWIIAAALPNALFVAWRWAAGRRPLLRTEERIGRLGAPVRYRLYSPRPRANLLQVILLDHYPRVFSVFSGTLSFVGVYPYRRGEFESLPDSLRVLSLDAKPGLTGLWWFYRGAGLTANRLRAMDVEYVQKWSLTYDMKTLLRSLAALIRTRGRLPEPDATHGNEVPTRDGGIVPIREEGN